MGGGPHADPDRREPRCDIGGRAVIIGATLAGKTGSFKAKTLTVSDILDHDTSRSVGGNVGLSTPGSADGLPGVSVQGSYARRRWRSWSWGGGVRDRAARQGQGAFDRPCEREPGYDEHGGDDQGRERGRQVYASDTSIKAVADGVQVVGRALGTVLEDITRQLGEKGEVSPEAAQRVGSIFKGLDARKISLEQVISCSGQTGFNLHDLLFPRAYASAGCTFPGKDAAHGPNDAERGLCLQIAAEGLRAKTESGEEQVRGSNVSTLADAIRAGDKTYGIGDKSVTEAVAAWGEFKHQSAQRGQAKFGEEGLADFDAVMIPFA